MDVRRRACEPRLNFDLTKVERAAGLLAGCLDCDRGGTAEVLAPARGVNHCGRRRLTDAFGSARVCQVPQPHGFEGLGTAAVGPRRLRLALPHLPDVVDGRFDARIATSQAGALAYGD